MNLALTQSLLQSLIKQDIPRRFLCTISINFFFFLQKCHLNSGRFLWAYFSWLHPFPLHAVVSYFPSVRYRPACPCSHHAPKWARMDSTPHFVSCSALPEHLNHLSTVRSPSTQHFHLQRPGGFVCWAKLRRAAGRRTAWIHVAHPHARSSFLRRQKTFRSFQLR